MRMRAFCAAVIVVLLALTPLHALDEDLDWLPPPRPVRPFWDIFHDAPVSPPQEVFSDLLLQIWLEGSTGSSKSDPGRLQHTGESLIEFGKLKAKLDLPDPTDLRELPYSARNWNAQESLNVPLPVVDSVFMFGQFDSKGDVYNNQQLTMKGKTGVGWKWSPFSRSELQLRTGPVVNYADVYNPVKSSEKSQLSVELQAKLDLFGPLQLQYSGEALPALVQADHRTLLQDLKIALPFGTNQELHIGAKYRWEDTLSSTPWLDRAQLYMGLKFQR